ncbi:MAG: peptidase S41 [Bacteroidetes bacterium]|nr:peptidase S41 [Bacteroidota bacterium]
MRKILFLLSLFIMICGSSLAENEGPFFISEPTLSPDASTIIFVYENDLWKVNVSGGSASRLTALEGIESNPRFSPDGKWLAFSSTQNGNADVYLMPLEGGAIKQLTVHDGNDFIESWAWDSKSVYFTSTRYNTFTSFQVNIDGGTPQRLFGDHYFNMPHHLVKDPVSDGYYFTESWESFMFPQRKRYVGDHNPDIKYYDPKKDEFKMLTNYEGKDLWPTVDRFGKVYFVSDEFNKEYNLYTFADGVKKPLTGFKSAIDRPQVSANGEKVVFCKDYQLFVYDVKNNKTTKPEIQLFEADILNTVKNYEVKDKIDFFDISSDNKKIAFISRGRLFVSDIKGKFVKEMKTNATERVREVKWMKDNKSLIYTRTSKGWANLFTINAAIEGEEKMLSNEEATCREIELNHDKTQAVYISGSKQIKMIDLTTLKISNLIDDEFWFRGEGPKFSPNDEYLSYTAYRNFERDIFVYNLKTKKSINLTNNGVAEDDPSWSPDGKYLYFSADRFKASFPRGTENNSLFRLPLYRFEKEFKLDEYDALFAKEQKKDSSKPEIIIDLKNLEKRWEPLTVRGGQQYAPYVIDVKGQTIVLFQSNHDKGVSGLWKMELDPFDRPKTEKIVDGRIGDIVESKDKIYALISGTIHELNLSQNKTAKIDVSYQFSKMLNEEFVQMYYENWAALDENYYDGNFHGADWKEVLKKNEKFFPYIKNRDNLRTLLNDMLGELNGSHLGFNSRGDEETTFYKVATAETGIVFDANNPYTVSRIVDNSPLDLFEAKVMAGDKLVKVNGQVVDATKNRQTYFSFANLPDELTLTFIRASKQFNVNVHPVSSRQMNTLLYDEWIANNQKRVDDKTNSKVAYAFMKDMGDGSLADFMIDMTTEAIHRDALILDLRYNRGGNIHDDVLQFLSQKPYLLWKQRSGKISTQPNFAPSGKPIVLLINEHSLSDAEMTAAGFRNLKLGTIIGTETYRWIVFTSSWGMVDGSSTRMPTWGCFDLNGDDLEMTGVKPDIYIKNTFKDRINGQDPQLDKAIEFILEKLK